MKDREQNQFEAVRLPPAWCSGICRHAMNEICVEDCAIKRDCSAFEPKPNLKLADLPRFPLKESGSMTKEEKYTSVTIYLAKVVDHLQGIEDEQQSFPIYHSPQIVTPDLKKAIVEVANFLQSSENENAKEKE
jgi:hypothetical protein